MSGTRPDLVVVGQIIVRASADPLRTVEAIGIRDGRVVVAGTRADVMAAAATGARVLGEPDRAVVPGIQDFHLHLIGMARKRRELLLDEMNAQELVGAVTGDDHVRADGWLRGRGWTERAMSPEAIGALNDALRGTPALLYSHDAHSAWASPAALAVASLSHAMPDPPGGRIERDSAGNPNGVLRERATDLVEVVAGRLRGPDLGAALDEALAELAGWGITGACDAGDTTAENGIGPYAALGDRASLLLGAAPRLEGRLRLHVGFPAEAIAEAAGLGIATGRALTDHGMVRGGWAKAYADGALGSRTAALFGAYTCGGGSGILRLEPAQLDGLFAAARQHRIGLAVHAIGDRAADAVLAAHARAVPRARDVPPDRIEHLQLLRDKDRSRLTDGDITASMQPVHCAADRRMVDECWSDAAHLAYPWRSLAGAGARLAFGSDAPIETANPWLGVYAAVHRRWPGDDGSDWQQHEALDLRQALAAYTSGPAAAAQRLDTGHLEPGALADLAVLNVDLDTLLAADERLAAVSSLLTLVGGSEVHRS